MYRERRRFVKFLSEISPLNGETAGNTDRIESRKGERNSRCRGEIRRYREEHRWRRRLSGLELTLRLESVGSKRD